jgi:hypothetical protein
MRRFSEIVVSIVTALLLARVGMVLMAADPAHPFVRAVSTLTAPLLAPVNWIDAQQPRYGVRFERGTLLLAGALPLALVAARRWRRPQREGPDHE